MPSSWLLSRRAPPRRQADRLLPLVAAGTRAARRVDSSLAVPHAELRVDVLQVLADGPDAQAQTVGSLLVGEAARDQRQNLSLPGGESPLACELVGAAAPAHLRCLQ